MFVTKVLLVTFLLVVDQSLASRYSTYSLNGRHGISGVNEGETYWLVDKIDEHRPIRLTIANCSNIIKPETDKLVFIIHDGETDRFVLWIYKLRNNIIKRFPNWNIVTVEWKGTANNTATVGSNIGDFINDMINQCNNVTADKFLLIGQNKGGHVCGFAGKKTKKAGNTLSRIIGLNPAYSPFNELPCEKRLCKTDAKYVSVIHTDTGAEGITIPIGHADFYPNNGTHQPRCDKDPYATSGCSDFTSVMYFNDGIVYPDKYLSQKCSDYDTFLNSPSLCENVTVHISDLFTTEEGIFYLNTTESEI